MFEHNNYSDFHKLSIEQQVSLDKHQEMVTQALAWGQHPTETIQEDKPVVIKQLRLSWTTALSLLGH